MSDKDHHRKRKAEREALREELLEAQFELRTPATRFGTAADQR
ncbi:hypothetical protein ULG90_11175 [Halopseudomonas pachastrellae]|nr:hypothetical protein ULG90_11175 [Halopseudomonas pachastrellae]